MTGPTIDDALRYSFAVALRAVEPGALAERHLPDDPPALILAVGKAALGMLAPARRRAPTAHWVASPPHAAASLFGTEEHLGAARGLLLPGSHPLPDAGSVSAAEAALLAVGRLGPRDLVLVLVSGGGSALWAAPRGVDLAAKRDLTQQLLLAGADIGQLNAVRKHLSGIKGGRLARATPARVLTLALSDVPGDDPGMIASGPTVPDASTFAEALTVLDTFGLPAVEVRAHLVAGRLGRMAETPKPGDEIERRATVEVIGSNATMLAAAAEYWRGAGHPVIVMSDALQGEARVLAKAHADLATALAFGDDPGAALAALAPPGAAASVIGQAATAAAAWRAGHAATMTASRAPASSDRRPIVVLSGGEATVTVTGGGRGGRNQEFALWLHHHLRRAGSDAYVAALVAGSDGVDGNSDAAGAVLSTSTASRAAALRLSPAASLRDNDSHSFFRRLGDTVVTGPTGTNVNDYRVMAVFPAR